MTINKMYDKDFYEHLYNSTGSSADTIAKLLYKKFQPNSVCDVGCGLGIWLAAFKTLGATEILGLDGEWVDENALVIPTSSFIQTDLTTPPKLDRQFDLTISLEVAEHLPLPHAEEFIDFLTSLSPIIMFSAAIPAQGGTGHVNEQWPSYWITLFKEHGFLPFDCIRPEIWNNHDLPVWYSQNIFLFVKQDKKELIKRLQQDVKSQGNDNGHMVDIVHPKMFEIIVDSRKALLQKTESQSEQINTLLKTVESLKVEQLSIKRNIYHLIKSMLSKFA